MDAFLTSLFALSLAEFGDRSQILCAALAIRYGRVAPIILGLGCATLSNCVISAMLGDTAHQWISEEPLQLFYALSLIFAGVGMLAWRRPVDLLENWSLGPFWTSFLGLFILQLGDKGQFILAATAARTDMWAFAAAGGWIGVMIACVPAILLRRQLAEHIPIRSIRYAGGGAFLLIGGILALGAWGII
ncbi:TMEM165/GDT1 family protein [Parasphingorhabdus sp.]|uniref:TMEM165/GDT1 family protein n=1 Tax=Parasphingorhabdus sp. TaxID=2709688 RepID=UPI003A8E58C1